MKSGFCSGLYTIIKLGLQGSTCNIPSHCYYFYSSPYNKKVFRAFDYFAYLKESKITQLIVIIKTDASIINENKKPKHVEQCKVLNVPQFSIGSVLVVFRIVFFLLFTNGNGGLLYLHTIQIKYPRVFLLFTLVLQCLYKSNCKLIKTFAWQRRKST